MTFADALSGPPLVSEFEAALKALQPKGISKPLFKSHMQVGGFGSQNPFKATSHQPP
jgi:hypothetical protein